MGRTTINVIKPRGKNIPSEAHDVDKIFTVCTNRGVQIPIVNDDKTVILLYNDTVFSADVKIKHGNGVQGINDLVFSVPASSFVTVSIDSGRFKNIYGEDKGFVIVEGFVKLAVFESA